MSDAAPAPVRPGLLADLAAQLNRATREIDVWSVASQGVPPLTGAEHVIGTLTDGDEPTFTVRTVFGPLVSLTGTRLPLAGTAVADALQKHQTIAQGDLSLSPYQCGAFLLSGSIRSALVSPLTEGINAFGAFILGYGTCRSFTDSDVVLASEVSSLVATTLSRVRLHAQVQQALRTTNRQSAQLRALSDLCRAVAVVDTEAQILDALSRHATAVVPSDCFVYATHGSDDSFRAVRVVGDQAGGDIASWLPASLRNANPIDVRDPIRFVVAGDGLDSDPSGYRHGVAAAIIENDRVSAVLSAISRRDEPYEVFDAQLLEQVGSTIAGKLESARLLRELRERGERYRLLTENTSDLICEVDARGRRLFVNPSYARALGVVPESLVGGHILERIHPDDLPQVRAEFERAISTRSCGRGTFRDRHENGEWRWFESTGDTFVTATGELRGVVISRDVTERRRQDEEQFRLAKLESVGVLAGGIAHDFNNLLTAIIGNVSLLQTFVPADSTTRQTLDDIEGAGRRATDLTRRLLTFSKGGAPVKRSCDVGRLVQDAVRFALSGSRLRCEFRVASDLWPAELDEGQIGQVFHNLALNASQAMIDGGLLLIDARNLVGGLNLPWGRLEAGHYVRLDFRDHGIGIPPEHLTRVFDPYFTTKSSGSGLGLTAAHAVVRAHGGQMTVDSVLGQGATFTVILPAAPGVEVRRGDAHGALRGSGRLLLMDDDIPVRRMVQAGLEKAGYTVQGVEDGARAVDAVREAAEAGHPFDVVLLDLTIRGGMGGAAALAAIRRFDSTVPAIVMSGYSTDPVLAHPAEYGFAGQIAKPFTVGELTRIVAEIRARSAGGGSRAD